MKYPPVILGAQGLLHGGDYNPEQWLAQKDIIWKEDMRLARRAGINTLTVGIFSWGALEPREGVFDFAWLDEVMDMLHQNGIRAILATPSGARPPWMAKAHPEVLRVSASRQKALYGGRHNHCPTSPYYREKVRQMNTLLAARYGAHPALSMWHISNEYGGECHCELCQKAFRDWLRARYGDIDTLNAAWWNGFWSHGYTDFDEIESPSPIGEQTSLGLNLSWRRFCSDQTVDFCREEMAALKAVAPDIPCTTNMMSTYGGVDYFALGKVLDVSSWDNYPAWTNTDSDEAVCLDTAFRHNLMRGVGGQKPFMMMESSPSMVNWHDINGLRMPGTLLLQGLQAVAHGSDSVQYFQFRASRGQSEQFHGAVVSHAGADTRVFREVTAVGQALKALGDVAGCGVKKRAALVYDWENRWAIEQAWMLHRKDKRYEQTVIDWHTALLRVGLPVDVINQTSKLDGYEIIAAPMCFLLRDGFAQRLTAFAQGGGTVVLTCLSGYVDKDGLCFEGGFPGPLKDLAGVRVEEIDALRDGQRNALMYGGARYQTGSVCELSHTQGARVVSTYDESFYRGYPAVTKNACGSGACVYVAARTGTDFMEALLRDIMREMHIKPLTGSLDKGVYAAAREGGGKRYLFVMNTLPTEAAFTPEENAALLYGDYTVSPDDHSRLVLPPRGVCVQVVDVKDA